MKYIDLTQIISPDMPVFPETETPKISCICTLEDNGFRENELLLSTHTGTHIDVPAHIFKNGLELDVLSLEHFIGPSMVINCSHLNKGEKISFELLYPIIHRLAEVDFVLFYTGWCKKWGQAAYFSDFPVPSLEAAQILSELHLKGVGIDAISVDALSSTELSVHKKFLSKGIVIIENLTNLQELVNRSFIFSCFPLKIKGADGSPVRAVARLE